MTLLGIAILLMTGVADDSAADILTLRDGRKLFGQVVERSAGGQMKVIVRRAWAESRLPDLYQRWKTVESGTINVARKQRRQRLEDWKLARGRAPEKNDQVRDWIESELKRLGKPFNPAEAPLMVATLNRAEYRSVSTRKEFERRLLRKAWIAGLRDAEELGVEGLKAALEQDHLARMGEDPVSVEELLPVLFENDNRWMLRRAATEAVYDEGMRFIRFETLVLPEGQEMAASDAGKALGKLLGDPSQTPVDPLVERFQGQEGRGKVGAVVTRLKMGGSAEIESTLWVRTVQGIWMPAVVQKVEARADPDADKAGAVLAEDPQIKAAFATLEALGLGDLGEDARRFSLRTGASVQTALSEARLALRDSLEGLVLPIRGSIRPRSAETP